jgi:hypothetical protein
MEASRAMEAAEAMRVRNIITIANTRGQQLTII